MEKQMDSKKITPQQLEEREKGEERQPYTAPAVIYSGQITTRAGSPVGEGGGPEAVDPADLFGK